jgi:hypothetical protein
VHSDVFLGTEAIARGAVTPASLRGSRFQRLLPNVYAPSSLVPDLALRSRAAYLWASGRGVLTGYSAAELWSARCAPVDAPVELTIAGEHVRAPAGVLMGQFALAGDERLRRFGVELATPLRTAYDLARKGTLVDAVVAVDALTGRFGFTPSELVEFAQRYPCARGTRRLPEVASLVEPGAESAMETRLRLVMVLAGLPRPVVQYPVVDERARVVATVDLAYPEELVAIEYEGADHFTDLRVRRDGGRYTRLAALGWRVYRYFAGDVYGRPEQIVRDMHLALTTRAIPPRRRHA